MGRALDSFSYCKRQFKHRYESVYLLYLISVSIKLVFTQGEWNRVLLLSRPVCEKSDLCIWQDLHPALKVISWLWPVLAGLTHPDTVCTRTGRGWLITPYLPWQIRVLTEHGLVTDPFLCPWKAWPVLWVLPRNEWLHSGPDHAVGVPLFPWLMALGCWTASRRSLLTWSDSVGDCQGPVASAASRDSCKERGASLKYTDPCLYNWPTTATLVTWLKLFSAADVPLSKAFNNP